MHKILNKLTKKDETPSTAELRELILRLERDEALESDAKETGLWAQEKTKPNKRFGFLSANMPPLKRKPKSDDKNSALVS